MSRSRTSNKGRILVLSAPSGAGKTTIAHRLLALHPDWRFSVSATTRERRANEVDGKDYYFLSNTEFRKRIAEGDLVEWENIYGDLYGTLRGETEKMLADGGTHRMIFDVDVKGALALRAAFPQETLLVFIAPPSVEELERRLRNRKTETDETIARRIARATMELAMSDQFDVVVVNDDIDRAVEALDTQLATQ